MAVRSPMKLPNGDNVHVNFDCPNVENRVKKSFQWEIRNSLNKETRGTFTLQKLSLEEIPSFDGKEENNADEVIKFPNIGDDEVYINSIEAESIVTPYEFVITLWVFLYWYFCLPPPDRRCDSEESTKTELDGKPHASWQIQICFSEQSLFLKQLEHAERIGLLTTFQSDSGTRECDYFASEVAFWQVDPCILFETPSHNPSVAHVAHYRYPAPTQYIFTGDIRHPIRHKAPAPGTTVYRRFIPSFKQSLSFKVVTLEGINGTGPKDSQLLTEWMNNPRVSKFWGEAGDQPHLEQFLKNGLHLKHSFPLIGYWDEIPFGYFEIYWVMEDKLGKKLGASRVNDYDRGIHCLVGNESYRGLARFKVWMSSLVHYCWLDDPRTQVVMMEPRVDNERIVHHCQAVGFFKIRTVNMGHKESNLLQIQRDGWIHPHT